jgi:1-aminocyclopropane-1-carboxylate deaminase
MNFNLHPCIQTLQQTFRPSPLSRIDDKEFAQHHVELWMKRDDLLHPVVSGNKWRKLKYPINQALNLGANEIISMGGQYSNHLHALAYAGKLLGVKTTALVRGEPPEKLTPTLSDMQDWGMKLQFVSRSDYRKLRDFKAPDSLPDINPNQYWIPEGGATELALQGVAEIVSEISLDFDCLAVACGTATTLAGLIANTPATRQILGVAALKHAEFLNQDVQTILDKINHRHACRNWQIAQNYHFGGFAKTTPALLAFMREFTAKHGIPLDQVYTGKLMYAIFDLLRQGFFQPGQRLIVVHTGGLQGCRH